jgi:hypothetical protein
MAAESGGLGPPEALRPEHARLVEIILRAGPAVPPRVRQHLWPLPLRDVLAIFAAAAPRVSRHPQYWRYGREVVEVPEPQMEEWYTQAWWGTCAAAACENRMVRPEREREVTDFADAVDWSPLDALAAKGRGVLLCGTHWGVPYVVPALLTASGRPVMQVGDWYKRHHAPGTDLSHAGEPVGLTRLYLQAYLRLREGATALIVPDGMHWRVGTEASFFGHPCNVSLAPAALARLTGAPALPYMAVWDKARLKIVFGTPWEPEPGEEDPELGEATLQEGGDRLWMRRYLDWLEGMVRTHPRAVRFNLLMPQVPLLKQGPHVVG